LKLRGSNERAILVVDALDESLGVNENGLGIINVLQSLDFPETFRVILSSKQCPELKHFEDPVESNRISLTGRSVENQDDIRAYIQKTLPTKYLTEENINNLSKASEGNFLYIVQVLKELESSTDDNECREILKKPPKGGLEGYYDWKFNRLEQRLTDWQVKKDFWRVARSVSLLNCPCTSELISDLLSIDHAESPLLFGPLEQFFDLALYSKEESLCRWFHGSLKQYLLDPKRLGEEEKSELLKEIMKNVMLFLKYKKVEVLPYDILVQMFDYHETVHTLPETLEFFRKEFFPSIILDTDKLHPTDYMKTISRILSLCLDRAESGRSVVDIFFFRLFRFAFDLYVFGDDPWRLIGVLYPYAVDFPLYMLHPEAWESAKDWRINEIVSLCRRLGAERNAKSISIKAVQGFKEGRINYWDLGYLMQAVWAMLQQGVSDLKGAYRVIDSRADEWFGSQASTHVKRTG
jgi:hypothetical protein